MFVKRLFGVWILFTAVFLLTVSCATNNNKNSAVSLDRAIQAAAVEIGDNVIIGQKMALLNFNSPSVDFSEYILDELESLLVRSRKFVVVDRRELDLIRQEENYQRSGEVSDESAQAIGKKLGAQVIVSGSLNIIGNTYRIRIRVINVESAAVEASISADINPEEEKTKLLLGIKPQTGVYNIGDIGPAGGIVFYDKGNFLDGWRYFEAAPASTEFSAQWGGWVDYLRITGLKNDIGYGRENTRIIAENLNMTYNSVFAAQLCQNLDFGGFNDWFLPNISELDLMYQNLKLKGLGNFRSSWYWSSSSVGSTSGKIALMMGYLGTAWCQSFSNGNRFSPSWNETHNVRAIRAF